MKGQQHHRKAVWTMEFAGLGLILAALGSQALAGAQASTASGFDAFPGFGRSAEASLRDDTIALWEAYQREIQVQLCMTQAGFWYEPTAEYPDDALAEVATYLNVKPATGVIGVASDANFAYEQALGPEARSRYLDTLYGVTSEQMDALRVTGSAATSDGNWGGCMGKADAGSSSVWDARRHLLPLYVEARRSLDGSSDTAKARTEYAACAAQAGVGANGPQALDEGVATGRIDPVTATKVATACEPQWAAAIAAAEVKITEAFIAAHRDELVDVRLRYEEVLDRIASDTEFAAYLATVLAAHAADDHD